MVQIEKIYNTSELTEAKIASHKAEVAKRSLDAAPLPVPSLVKSLGRVDAKKVSETQNYERRMEAYLVDNGMRDQALSQIVAALGPLRSNSILEAALRRNFAKFDTKNNGTIDMSDFHKLLVALNDPPEDVEVHLNKIHIDKDGFISYLHFIKWWLSSK